MAKKVFTDESLATFVDEIKSYTDSAVSTKANSSHTHSISNVTNLQTSLDGKVPTSRTVNGKSLSSDITLFASDVGAATSSHTHSSYVNQNAFSNVKVGSTTVSADTTTDTLELVAGSNITITPDATNDKVTIAATDTTYGAAGSSLGLVKSGGDVTISSGTITVNDDSHNHVISNIDNLQSSLDAKQATITGGASTITSSNLTANRALISNGSGKVAVSAVTSTELGYLDGVTSGIQSQLDSKKSFKTTRFIVGTSTSGWTSSDCDYLCDGTSDDVEIKAAIAALPANGGEIVILDGTYNIASAIVLSGTHITLKGNNGATKFVRAFSGSSSAMGVIVITGNYCTVQGLTIDGVKSTYNGYYHSSIYVSGGYNNLIENEVLNNETSGIYISTASASYNTIHGNKSHDNNGHGIYNNSTNVCNTFSDNTCENNEDIGIYVGNNGKNTVTGNICIANSSYGIGLYTEDSGVSGNVCNGNIGSGLYSTNAKNNGISGNAFNSNGAYGIQLGSNTSGNSLSGNTCVNNTSGDINDAGSNNIWVASHNHSASEITSGALSSNRLPTVPITKGGTGATTAAGALTNLGITATAAELNKMDGITATTAELNYCDGVTSNIQTQLNAKAASSHTHNYLPLSGGTVTGNTTFNKNVNLGSNATLNGNTISSEGKGVPIIINPNSTGADNEHTEIGALKCLGNIHLQSGIGIHARMSNGGEFRHIVGYDPNNNLVFGQDAYMNSSSDVYYQGKTVYIRSVDNINITSPTAGLTNRAYGVNKLLWDGTWYMNASHTITLNEAISAQPNGIVLVWSWFNGTDAANYCWVYNFIPKYHVLNHSGLGVCCDGFSTDGHMAKYLYISDTGITGYDDNQNNITKDGVTFKNGNYVLRHVIGV